MPFNCIADHKLHVGAPLLKKKRKEKKKAKVFIFTSRPFQPKAGLPRGGGVKKTHYL